MIELIDKNFNLHAKKIAGQTNGMKVVQLSNLTYIDSTLSCDTFNIIHIFSYNELLKKELEEALKYFRNRKLDYCIWINEMNLQLLAKNSLRELSTSKQNEEIGMVLNLEMYQPIRKENHKNIKIVNTQDLLRDYARVIAENWTPPDKNVLSYYEMTSERYLDESNKIDLLTYYQNKKAVSTIELFPSNDDAVGLYGFATLEESRGQGIGTALITYALNKAKEKGYKKAILQASEDGIGIYRKYGFVEQTAYYEYT